LLGLVFKIVQDKQEPIPNHYSKEMNSLVHTLLDKNANERPQVIDILRLPYVQKYMKSFVESQGKETLNPKLNAKVDVNLDPQEPEGTLT